MNKIKITGINFDNLSMAETLKLVENNLKNNIKTIVYTPNVEIAYSCYYDSNLLNIINSANLILPDGDGIIKASKKLSTPLKEKVAGVDFGYNILPILEKYNQKLYLLGGKEENVIQAKNNLLKSFPNLDICGYHNGYFNKYNKENSAVIKDIIESGANVVYVCFGFPEQEKWVYNNRTTLSNIKIFACLGGSIDIYANKVKRAPKVFRKLHLEWLYRTIKEPKRIKRVLVIPKYFKIIKNEIKNK